MSRVTLAKTIKSCIIISYLFHKAADLQEQSDFTI